MPKSRNYAAELDWWLHSIAQFLREVDCAPGSAEDHAALTRVRSAIPRIRAARTRERAAVLIALDKLASGVVELPAITLTGGTSPTAPAQYAGGGKGVTSSVAVAHFPVLRGSVLRRAA